MPPFWYPGEKQEWHEGVDLFRLFRGLGSCFLIVAAVDTGLKTIEFSVDLDPTFKEWRAATAGPMTAEKQMASEIRSQGAPQWGAAGYAQLALFEVKGYEESDSWRRVSMVWILFLEEIAAALGPFSSESDGTDGTGPTRGPRRGRRRPAS